MPTCLPLRATSEMLLMYRSVSKYTLRPIFPRQWKGEVIFDGVGVDTENKIRLHIFDDVGGVSGE